MILYCATSNAGKLQEFRSAAVPGVEIEPFPCLNVLAAPEETGHTFEANATLKALYYARHTPDMPVFAEDSGLAVDALGGAPGIHSARFYLNSRTAESAVSPASAVSPSSEPLPSANGQPPAVDSPANPGNAAASIPPPGPDAANNALLLKALASQPNRRARYVAVIALALPGEEIRTFRGEVEGEILTEYRGEGGFGYDPLFFYPPFGQTFAELSKLRKLTVSHRGRAVAAMMEYLVRAQGPR